jgi:ADP-ribose pyrophosphatase
LVVNEAWTLLESRMVSDHRILRVRHDLYRFEPSGREGEFVVLESPDWVNVIPLTDDGQVVLIRQYRHGIREATLEIPGGLIDPGEAPEAAAVRELREETGYVAREVRPLGRVRPNPAIQNNHQYCYLAEGCRRMSELHLDPFECVEVVPTPLTEIPELIRREAISNTLVVAAFYFLGELRKSL